MTIEELFALLSNQDILFKFGLVILILLYIIFAILVYVQINSLNKVVNQVSFSPIFKFLGLTHLLAAIALLFTAVLFL